LAAALDRLTDRAAFDQPRDRLGRGVKGRRKSALVAGMRQLLVVAWAMLRDRQPYRPALLARAG